MWVDRITDADDGKFPSGQLTDAEAGVVTRNQTKNMKFQNTDNSQTNLDTFLAKPRNEEIKSIT